MTRRRLAVVILLALLTTGTLIAFSGWLRTGFAGPVPSERPTLDDRIPPSDAAYSHTAWQWQTGQPTHWRSCLMHR